MPHQEFFTQRRIKYENDYRSLSSPLCLEFLILCSSAQSRVFVHWECFAAVFQMMWHLQYVHHNWWVFSWMLRKHPITSDKRLIYKITLWKVCFGSLCLYWLKTCLSGSKKRLEKTVWFEIGMIWLCCSAGFNSRTPVVYILRYWENISKFYKSKLYWRRNLLDLVDDDDAMMERVVFFLEKVPASDTQFLTFKATPPPPWFWLSFE